jgi:2-polyprenyl-3-methyl-5-hydroxy-6-metoxy-1,4-benzoquinol methylase
MTFQNAELVERNRNQLVSEKDDFTERRYAHFVKHFPAQTQDVLDIGCNTGRGGRIMKAKKPNLRIVGFDCVPDRLERIDSGIYESTICGFGDNIDAPSGSFDAVVLGEVIEHIPGPAVFPTLCEIFRVLRLGGRILLTTPNPRYLRNWLHNKSVLLDSAHVSQHTAASMRRKLEDAGFSRVRIYGTGRMSSYVGQSFPLLSAYGSYLASGTKW